MPTFIPFFVQILHLNGLYHGVVWFYDGSTDYFATKIAFLFFQVISLCWKAGSSEAGLAGMKEVRQQLTYRYKVLFITCCWYETISCIFMLIQVAKGYIDSQRVGFAHICPGSDLYVCPHSDAIITILAKYGFFKGRAAVEDNRDSLIGCVIWRRGHPSSNSCLKISEKKNTPVLGQQPSNSLEPSVPEINSPITQASDLESKQERTPSTPISSLDKTTGIVDEKKALQSTNNLSHVSCGLHLNSMSEVIPSMPYSSPLVQVQPPDAHKIESTSLQEIERHTEVPISQAAEPKKHDAYPEPGRPVLQTPPPMLQGVQRQTSAQFSNGSYNFNYNSCPPPKPGNSPLIRPQLPTTQSLDSSCSSNLMQTSSRSEFVPSSLPGPPPLPRDILERILQIRRDVHQVSSWANFLCLSWCTCCPERKLTDWILSAGPSWRNAQGWRSFHADWRSKEA